MMKRILACCVSLRPRMTLAYIVDMSQANALERFMQQTIRRILKIIYVTKKYAGRKIYSVKRC